MPKGKKQEALDEVTNISVSRHFTIPMSGQYESMKVGVTVSGTDYDTVSALCEEKLGEELAKASEQYREYVDSADEEAEELSSPKSRRSKKEEPEEEPDESAEGDVSAEDIEAMSRKDLEEFIDENDLEDQVDISDFAKNKKGTADLKAAIIEAMGGGGESDVTADDINGMKRSELVAFIEENDVDVDPEDHKQIKALREAVIEELGLEEGEEAAEEDDGGEDDDNSNEDAPDFDEMDREELEEFISENDLEDEVDIDDFDDNAKGLKKLRKAVAEAHEAAGGGDSGDENLYTREELEDLDIEDLEAIYKEWKIKDKFPTGSKAAQKKKAVNRILAFQDAASK